jgi:hypothetical protein
MVRSPHKHSHLQHRNYSRGVLDTFGSSIHLPWQEFEGEIHGCLQENGSCDRQAVA